MKSTKLSNKVLVVQMPYVCTCIVHFLLWVGFSPIKLEILPTVFYSLVPKLTIAIVPILIVCLRPAHIIIIPNILVAFWSLVTISEQSYLYRESPRHTPAYTPDVQGCIEKYSPSFQYTPDVLKI